MAAERITIDLAMSAARIEHDIETLSGPAYTSSDDAIRRYAYIPEYRNTLDYFTRELKAVGFDVSLDPVGNLIARNRPKGKPAFGVGSHCDSNRNGGRYDGTLGVVTALEICRISTELGLDLPLQLISFLEEESSGFGQGVLGSRIMTQQVTDEDLRENFRALDDGRSFWDHATEAGLEPARWRECAEGLDGLVGWIELHIEQGRVLQDKRPQVGIVTAIVGITWVDLTFHGRADHAGGTPMGYRADAGLAAAETVVELEKLANAQSIPTVGTAGVGEFHPGLHNVIPGEARLGLDIRSIDESVYRAVVADIVAFAEQAAEARKLTLDVEMQDLTQATGMDEGVVGALEGAAAASGHPFRLMPSGGGHDTQHVAPHVPSAMVFVPCKDGISHSPDELANPADAAAAAEIMLNAIARLTATA